MADGNARRERSESIDLDDSDLESHQDDSSRPAKPGRKKNPNSQAARRDQNRIAQREFRLRKQQRIRDLEARVEILSGGKDEAIGEMRNILKDLMAENQTLRNLVRGLASFIGDGTGGILPKLGWELSEFNNIINRSETDTAIEGYQNRKKMGSAAGSDPGPSTSSSRAGKRPAEDDSLDGMKKKARVNEEHDVGRSQQSFPPPVPIGGPLPTNDYSSQTRHGYVPGSNNSPIFMPPTNGSSSSQYPLSSNGYSYLPPVGLGMDQSIPPLSFNPQNGGPLPPVRQHLSAGPGSTTPTSASEPVEDDDDTKLEAHKLINYHLENYKRNSQYCLPSSLRPTLVQKTVPHESVIDKILHPELRDRMILLRDRYNLVDCLMDYRTNVTIHGDDVLAHTNWEIGEIWLRKYGFLVDPAVLSVANRWRKERGEPELRVSDFNGADTPGST
ncbi:hypothetical protein BDN72DRAFT_810061 [Pluteus cervinus]|uniref:Uncharacterized protein n=1 Tax=Pluteus cervinus TaxID=181527 RepID=A0ACD3BEC5_9AGAR|nr:hypothetical protein BDN72DRAFT_810061 [Pluteus cervinus]